MRKGIFLLALLLCGLPQALMAQQQMATPLEFRLDQITVFGEKEPEMARTAAVNDIIINEDIIEATPGDNLADLLQSQGFMVIPAGNADGNTFLVLRGFRNDHLGKEIDGRVLIMIDGRRSGASDLATISLLNVERVEVLRGPEMLQYSAAFSGGIINVVTKRPKGEVPMSGMIEAGMGTDGYYKGQIAVNGATSGFDYSMGYRYTETDDFHDAKGDKVQYSSTDHMDSFTGNVGYTFLDNHRIGVNGYYYKADGAHKPAYTDQFGDYYDANYSDKENWFVNFSYDGQTRSGDWAWDISYSFGENNVQSWSASNPADAASNAAFAHWYKTQTAQGRLTYHGSIFDISGGLQWTDYDVDTSSRTSTSVILPGRSFIIPAGRLDSSTSINYGAYLMGRLFLLDESLVLSAALRYDWYNVKDDGQEFRKQVTDKNNKFDGFSPSLGVAYLPLDWLKLRANYTRTFRAPSGRELLEDRLYNYWGNPENDAEKTDTYEAGFDLLLDYANFSLTYFYSYTKDYIYQHNDPKYNNNNNSNRVPWTEDLIARQYRTNNADKQIRDGIELQTSVDIAKFMGWNDWEVRPSYSFTYIFRNKEKYRSYSSWEKNTMQTVPNYAMAGGLFLRYIPGDFTANVSVSYFGKYNSSTGSDQNYYTMVNASVEKRLLDFGQYGQLNLKAEVRNMFDEKYYGSTTSYYMPGRTFYVGTIYKF